MIKQFNTVDEATNSSDIMRGSFSDYTLSQVLNVANIGNQYIGIELINSNSEEQGTIIIKDSQVLFIKIGNTSGY